MKNKNYYKEFVEFLRKKNLKLTKQRKIIIDAILNSQEHFNVDILYEQIRRKYKNVSKSTIYRTMPLLIESGLLKQSLRCQAKEHYEHLHGDELHIRFICEKCGKIIEERNGEIENIISILALNNSFTIKDNTININGICSDCLESNN